MLFVFPPMFLAVLRLATANAADPPRLELTAHGVHARELAADVLVDADTVADLVLVDHAAIFSVDSAGERHELRLELTDDGTIVGAAVWWTGPATGDGRYDLSLALPALAESASLDAITLEDDTVVLEAGGVRVPLGGERTDELVSPWDASTEPGC